MSKKLSNAEIQRKQLEIIAKNLKDQTLEEQYSVSLVKESKRVFNQSQKIVIKEVKAKTTNEQLTRDLPSKFCNFQRNCLISRTTVMSCRNRNYQIMIF